MEPYIISSVCDLHADQMPVNRATMMVKGDGLAHRWSVTVLSGGHPVNLEGSSVTGYFVRDGKETIWKAGTISGNVATVELPDEVYSQSGPVYAFMRLSDQTRKVTIDAMSMRVRTGATDVIIDPDNRIPDIDTLLAQIEHMRKLEEDVTSSEAARKAAERERAKTETAHTSAENVRAGAEAGRIAAETARATSEDARKNAETKRAEAEAVRVTSEDTRKSAETGRANAEASRVAAEDARKSAETGRANAETARKTAEDARKSAETKRAEAEAVRVTAEDARKSAETGRANAEASRVAAEDARKSAETKRAEAEAVRVTSEDARKSAETGRANAEASRVAAEDARKSAETGRANAETARKTAEDARKSAETKRAEAEAVRGSSEDARKSAETKRAEAEAVRVTSEDARKSAETGRANAEASRVAAEDARKSAETGRTNAEASRVAAEDARKSAEMGRANAETARKTAEDARKSAETGREQAEAKRVADSAKALLDAQAAVDAADGWARAEASARTLDVGAAASASVTTSEDGHKLLTLGLPRGERGPRGRGLTAMGDWTAGVQYLCSDDVQHFVLYEDSSYVCHQSHMSGAESAPPAAAYWTLLASKGSVDNLPGMRGATADTAGEAGLVPTPAAGTQGRYLRGDGTWQTPPNTTYGVATASADGLMAKGDKAKLDGVATNANNYAHPTNAGNKHIPAGGANGQILRWSADGTAAWGADNNTTYSDMKGATADTAGEAGLVPAPAAGTQGKYLRGDGTWQTPPNTTYSPATSSANGLMSAEDKTKLDGFGDADSYLDHPVAFSLPVSAWTGSGPYSAVISDARFAPDIKIDSTDFNADTIGHLPNAAIDYETAAGKITLTTAIKPSGTLAGTFWARRVAQD